jgi:hypothetical protein
MLGLRTPQYSAQAADVDGLDRPSSWNRQNFLGRWVFGMTMRRSLAGPEEQTALPTGGLNVAYLPISGWVAAHPF